MSHTILRLGFAAASLLAASAVLSGNAVASGAVVVCPVTGMVDDGLAVLVKRAVREAEGAQALVLEVDTPGGLVDSAIKITSALTSARVHTIAYVKGMGAISAGALISFACDDIIMAPGSNMGAATPVVPSAEGMTPTGEKEVSFLRAKMRALAEENHHNPAIAEAMVDKDVELWMYKDAEGKVQVAGAYGGKPEAREDSSTTFFTKVAPELRPLKELLEKTQPQTPSPEAAPPAESGSTVHPAVPPGAVLILPNTKLLTLTPQEALEYGVIPMVAGDLKEVLDHFGLGGAEVRRLDLTNAERIFRWLTNPLVAGLLLMLGIGGIYLEIKTPGFGLPGIVGIVCLSLFFGAHLVLGIAEWLDVLLVVVGVALLLVELFLIPGFGVVGAAGILCLLAGIYLALTGAPIPQYSWDYERLHGAAVALLVALVSLTAFVVATWKLLPRTPLYRFLVLTYAQKPEAGYTVQAWPAAESFLGREGVAVSMLRPTGRGRFGDTTLQVVTRAEFIEPGTPIVIVQVDGNRYVVDKQEGLS